MSLNLLLYCELLLQELQKLLAIDMKFKVINEIQAPCQWLLRINLSFIPTV